MVMRGGVVETGLNGAQAVGGTQACVSVCVRVCPCSVGGGTFWVDREGRAQCK